MDVLLVKDSKCHVIEEGADLVFPDIHPCVNTIILKASEFFDTLSDLMKPKDLVPFECFEHTDKQGNILEVCIVNQDDNLILDVTLNRGEEDDSFDAIDGDVIMHNPEWSGPIEYVQLSRDGEIVYIPKIDSADALFGRG